MGRGVSCISQFLAEKNMHDRGAQSRGRLVATALVGCWRKNPPAWQPNASELDAVGLHLLASGVGALAWRRLRDFEFTNPELGNALRQQYRLNTVLALLHGQKIEHVVSVLNSAGIEPMLVKGWAAARLYPDDGLRPYADIDLCIHPRQFAAAKMALAMANIEYNVDLHDGFAKFGGGNPEDIFTRAITVKVGAAQLQIPSPEDHLRILAIHMLREGAWRALWLCDVAAAVESRSEDFDWDVCLGRNKRWSNWVGCAMTLAGELLGLDVSKTTPAVGEAPLPPWLVPAILNEWGSAHPSMMKRHGAPM